MKLESSTLTINGIPPHIDINETLQGLEVADCRSPRGSKLRILRVKSNPEVKIYFHADDQSAVRVQGTLLESDGQPLIRLGMTYEQILGILGAPDEMTGEARSFHTYFGLGKADSNLMLMYDAEILSCIEFPWLKSDLIQTRS